MSYQDEDFFKQLLSMFKLESDEHVGVITSGLVKMQETLSEDDRTNLLESVFRAAHSLKGAARTVGLTDIEPIGQSLENVFSIMKNKKMDLSAELFNMLNQAIKMLGVLISSMDEQGKIIQDKSELTRLIDRINEHMVLVGA
ncbi:Hpt domain-containing protein [bacterium]|nr:Hpt domain-containing protein [bacterium]